MPKAILKEYGALFKRTATWLYLFLFFLIAGFSFISSVILSGYSSLTEMANYLILCLPALFPLLIIRKKETADQPLVRFAAVSLLYICSLLITLIFNIIIAFYGVFKWSLYINTITNLLLYGFAIISLYLFLNVFFSKVKYAIVAAYVFAAILIGIEIINSYIVFDGLVKKIFNNLSISKFFQGNITGILDVKVLLFLISATALFLILSILKTKKINLSRNKTMPAVSALLGVYLLFCFVTPNGISRGIDMTPGNFYSLSDETKDFLGTVDQDITITVLEREDTFTQKDTYSSYFLQAQKIMEQLAKENSAVVLQYIDPEQDTEWISMLSDQGIAAEKGDIVVENDGKYQVIPDDELFNFNYQYDQEENLVISIDSSKAEQEICSAIDKLTSPTSIKIAIATGYEEHDSLTTFQEFIVQTGTEVDIVDISADVADSLDEYKLVILYAPAADYDNTALERMQSFLYNDGYYGKNMLYVVNSDSKEPKSNLNTFLELWEIGVDNYTIVETNLESTIDRNEYYGWSEYQDISFVSNIDYLENPVIIPQAQVILYASEPSLEITPLLKSKETSSLMNNEEEEELLEEYGSFNTVLTSTYHQSNVFETGTTGIQGSVSIIGSEKAFAQDLLAQDSNSNREYFTDLITELSGVNEVRVSIYAKTLNMKAVSMTQPQTIVFAVAFVIVLPLFFLSLLIIRIIKNRKYR